MTSLINADWFLLPAMVNDMSSKIKSEIKLVTPEMAKEFLLCNEQNRRVRSSWVNYLTYCIKADEWKLTHQGIAFSECGRLLDGQHRLMAIVKADLAVNLMITYGWDPLVFSAIDNAMRRSDEDRTNIDKRTVECAKFFLSIMEYAGFEKINTKSWHGQRSTPKQIIFYASIINDYHKTLINKSPSTNRFFSTVPSRCAAIANMMLGDDIDYIVNLYKKLTLGHTDDLPPIARSAMRQFITGSLNSTGGSELRLDNFVRFLTLYRKDNENTQKLILRDRNDRLAQIKQDLMPWFMDTPTDKPTGKPSAMRPTVRPEESLAA
jgi:hypothetical protein